MKNKNKLLTKCITGLVLSVTALASAAYTDTNNSQGQNCSAARTQAQSGTIFPDLLTSYAAISGGALNIAGESVVDRDLAAKAAVVIGAGSYANAQNIYAGAAVTIGALATVKDIVAGAAATIGGGATTSNIHSGAAITLGAFSNAKDIYAGSAITYGAGAKFHSEQGSADLLNSSCGIIQNSTDLTNALVAIKLAQTELTKLKNVPASEALSTVIGGTVTFRPGLYDGTALTIDAGSTIYFDSSESTSPNNVWVINLSQALSVGGSSTFKIIENANPDSTYTIIWNVTAALNLGAGTSFIGTALVDGAVNAATASVSCGHLYAKGIVSVGSIGTGKKGLCGKPIDLQTIKSTIDTLLTSQP